MQVLSLFNGMSFGMMALEELDISVSKYYSSEIDKYAIQASQILFPDIIQLGDVTEWFAWDIELGDIDLLLAGFPCQAWSMAGKQEGDDDPRGALVHDLIDIWKQINIRRAELGKEPVKIMFENVKMKKQFLDYINELFGVEPICINSALVSAQNRVRYYWTNVDGVGQPEDEGVMLRDIIESNVHEDFYHSEKAIQYMERGNDKWMQAGARRADRYEQSINKDKAFTVTANIHKGVPYNYFKCGSMIGRKINPETGKRDDYNPNIKTVQRIESRADDKTGTITTVQKDNLIVKNNSSHRKLTPRECFRLQTVPEHHIETLLNSGISNSQLYKMCGNGWTHKVIVNNLKGLKQIK